MNQDDINEREWRDPANWTWRGPLASYASRRDSRLLVPKATPWMGWTFNFAHPRIKWGLALLAAVPLVVLLAQHVFS
jgi:uncharacterized membrane protein